MQENGDVLRACSGAVARVLEPTEATVKCQQSWHLPVEPQQGDLPQLPTLLEWSAGTTIPGWNTTAGNSAVAISLNSFEYFGWACPGTTTAAACY
jgi:hypothetical protein